MALFVVRALPLVISLTFAFCGFSLLTAATLTWDGNLSGSGQPDGGGNWDTSTADRWSNDPTSQAWSNTTPDSAIFGTNTGGATGTLDISLTEGITAHDLSFRLAGSATYNLTTSNGSKLTLGGPDTPVIDTAVNASIQAAIAGNQGFTKTGAGILTLSGSASNENTGLTTVTAGTLRLEKNSGSTAINGDILINGGTLTLGLANQIADTASITLDSGNLQFAGLEETIKNLTLNGGDSNTNDNSNGQNLTITDTLTINSHLLLNSNAVWQANKMVIGGTSGEVIYITGNSNTKISTLAVGPGGLVINAGRRIVLNPGSSPSAKGSQLLLGGNVTVTGGSTSIDRSTDTSAKAYVELGSAIRTFQIDAGAFFAINVSVTGSGGITKTGEGSMHLAGRISSTFTGMTTLNAGTLKLAKSDGATTIPGDITVNAGVLDWDFSNQIANTSTLYLNGGALSLSGFSETVANLYQTGGTVNFSNANSAIFIITGILDVTGGSEISINPGGAWSAADARFANIPKALSLSGNHTSKVARFTAGSNGTGGITLAGGQTIDLLLGSAINAKGSELVLDGSFTANGDNQIITSAGAIGFARTNLKGGQRNFNINSGTTTFDVPIISTTIADSGAVNTAGGITKNGAGTLELKSFNTYSGNTIINAGTLKLGFSGSIASSPRIVVATSAVFDVSEYFGYSLIAGQKLEGGGTILGDVIISEGATVSAGTIGGDITQALTFSGGLTLEGGSTTIFDLGSGNDYDRIIIEGNFVQEAGAQILFQPNGFSPTAGGMYNFFTFFGGSLFVMPFGDLFRTGADDDGSMFDLPDISSSGMYWDLTQLAITGTITISPEPGRALLILGGLTTILFHRRRQSRSLRRTQTWN